MSASASLRAQAKINLGLRILAREASGYHQLETTFCRLELADHVHVELTPASRSLVCEGPAIPAGGLGPETSNLAWRAAVAFLDAAAERRGFRIHVEKRIPVGGGLGGGSADAGAVLRLLHHLVGRVALEDVLSIAGSLGADVPFLTQATTPLALAWGRGERLLPLGALPSRDVLLVVAPFGVGTADAYGWLAGAGLPAPGPTVRSPAHGWEAVTGASSNDFETVVLSRHPALASAMEALSAGTPAGTVVQMTGSGATLYALPPDRTPECPVPDLPAGFTLLRTRTAASVAAITTGDYRVTVGQR